MKKIVLSVKEVAELLDVSTTTIYTMVRCSEIPHTRIRSKIVFHAPTIEKWVAGESEEREVVMNGN